MTWQTFVFLPIVGITFVYSLYRMLILLKLVKAHRGKDISLDGVISRVTTTCVNVLGQKSVFRDRKPGIMHATIFWGFIVITIGTVEQFVKTVYQSASFEFIGMIPYRVFIFLQDIFTLSVLLAVMYAFYRRFVLKPEHLGRSRDASVILLFIGSLMISIFLMNAFNILGLDSWYKQAMPVSYGIAVLFSSFSFDNEMNIALGTIFKWIHILIVFGFIMYLPGSKHLHIIAAAPNVFLRHLSCEKGMKPINFDEDSTEQYGAVKVIDMSWKDALDYYSCTECGRCQEVCPAWNTQKPLSPKNLIVDLKNNMLKNKDKILDERYDEISHVIDENVTEDVIWACTSCRACEIACPVFIEHTNKIFEVRRNLVMMESRFPSEIKTVFKNLETNANPWTFSSADRINWAEGLSIKTLTEEPNNDFLLWVGCAGSYDDRNRKVLRSFVNILKKAEIKFAILGNEEQCTGDPARRIGNEYLYQTFAKSNVETLNRYNVKKILTTCPHGFNTLKNEYPCFGGYYEVYHHSQFIAKLISDGRIKPSREIEETVVFHDSCYLGRWNDVYYQPRQVIQSIPSARLVEMKGHHEKSMCCGAGGGRMWMEETIGKPINIARVEQALHATAGGIIATTCPFCMTMLNDGVRFKEAQDKIKVLDIAELIDQSTI